MKNSAKTKIENDAFEWSVDYKPFEDDDRPDLYARYGFIKGANMVIEYIKEIADKLDDIKWDYEEKYLKSGNKSDLDRSNECNTELRCLNKIIEFYSKKS